MGGVQIVKWSNFIIKGFLFVSNNNDFKRVILSYLAVSAF